MLWAADDAKARAFPAAEADALLRLLRATAFPERAENRRGVRAPGTRRAAGITLGKVFRWRDDQVMDSAQNARYPELLAACRALVRAWDPAFPYSTVCVARGQQTAPHRDAHNVGFSCLVALGDFEGGELVVRRRDRVVALDPRGAFVKFDARDVHHNLPFRGERYSIAYFWLSSSPQRLPRLPPPLRGERERGLTLRDVQHVVAAREDADLPAGHELVQRELQLGALDAREVHRPGRVVALGP